jgi:hypothetical protein
MRGRWVWGVLALMLCAALLPSGCKDSTSPGGPGQLTVSLTSDAGSGAAFLLTVSGHDVTDPAAATAGHLIYSLLSEDTARIAVIGELRSGPLLKFTVPDVTRAHDYSVRLEEVAGADNRILPTSDFSLSVTR